MISLVIVANGTSQRFGTNKMLLKIESEYLVNKTISCFSNFPEIDEIILVSNQEIFNVVKNKNVICIEGSDTRTKSVKKGLKIVSNECVLIHDGARPFVSKEIIFSLISNLEKNDCVVPVLKITNCLKKMDGLKVKTVNRDDYLQTQTPQAFKTKVLKECFEINTKDLTDDCQALEETKYKIKFIEGSDVNKKITFPEDI